MLVVVVCSDVKPRAFGSISPKGNRPGPALMPNVYIISHHVSSQTCPAVSTSRNIICRHPPHKRVRSQHPAWGSNLKQTYQVRTR